MPELKMLALLFASILISQTSASGSLELSFKSEFRLKAFVNITSSFSDNSTSSTSVVIPFTILPNVTEKLAKIPIDLENVEKTEMMVFVINEDRPDIDNTTITAEFTPTKGMVSPLTVMFPFNGIKINVICDPKWYGEKCDQFCCSDTAERVGKQCNSLGQLGCPKGSRGMDCGQAISKKWCKCKNGGVCISSFGKNLSEKVLCECPLGTTGVHCEKEVKAVELKSTYGVDPKKFQIGTAKMLYESVVDNEFVEVKRAHSTHVLHNLRINDA